MTLISVLIVLAIEFHFRKGSEYRNFNWFEQFHLKISDWLAEKPFFEGWGGVVCVIGLPVLALILFINAFDGGLYLLLLFLASCAVLFLSLGPHVLRDSFAPYFEALERGDAEAAYLNLQKESLLEGVPQSDEMIRDATRAILTESQFRYFGVIFWFVFLGPYGALFYRLSHYYHQLCIKDNNEEHLSKLNILLHWLDWAPARLTSILFLFTGDFANGFNRVKDYFVDFKASSRLIISETGMAALNLDMSASEGDVKENHEAFAMVERTIILYLVVVAALTPLAFW